VRQRLKGVNGRLARSRRSGGQNALRRQLHGHRRSRANLRAGFAENRIQFLCSSTSWQRAFSYQLSAVSSAFLVRKSSIAAKRLNLANHFDN
jgi:hypothetical protein